MRGAGGGKMGVFTPIRGEIAWIAVFSVATNLLVLALPLHMMAIYDRVLTSGSVETLVYITLIALGALALLGAGEALRLLIAGRMSARLVTVHGERVLASAMAAPDGEPADGPRELQALRAFVASRAFVGLFDLPFAPFFVALMFALHAVLGLVTLAGMLVLVLIAAAQHGLAGGLSAEAQRRSGDLTAFTATALRHREDARPMGMGPAIARRWGAAVARALTVADRAGGVGAVAHGLTRFVRQGLQVVILALGAWLVLAGDLSGGVIFASSIVFGRAIAPIEAVIGGWERLVRARLDARAVRARLEEEVVEGEAAFGKPLGRLEARGLGYAATDMLGQSVPLLTDASFALEPGRIMAVIGPSGAGKSVLARLLAGALPASEGCVRLDGHDVGHWSDERRARSIGYVGQEVRLFPGTVADNIARLRDDIDEERIVWAARFAGALEMIASLPHGFATPVGGGVSGGAGGAFELSGGQRQLIGLARAVVTRPRLLVLDEPNAHLDQRSEAQFLRALTNARHEGTSAVVVTQRRSVLQVADRIATVNGGRLVSVEENAGQWKLRENDARRDELHEEAREAARRANAALSLADRLGQELEMDVRQMDAGEMGAREMGARLMGTRAA